MIDVTSFSIETNGGRASIVGLPQSCPYCHKHIRPYSLYGYLNQFQSNMDLLLVCPNRQCDKAFFGYYKRYDVGSHPDSMKTDYRFTGETSIGSFIKATVSETIEGISPNFSRIYNQAYQAEQSDLTEVCGMGYRKSLEFLIKDYLIKKNTSEKSNIEKQMLGACISRYIENSRIKESAKRAAWLGNDETHYIRTWNDKTLSDLKQLIDLTRYWIEMEELADKLEREMPDGKK
jgi:hypothetical protein